MEQRPAFGSRGTWLWGLAVGWGVLVLLLGLGFVTSSWGYVLVIGAPMVAGYTIGRWVRMVKVLRIVVAVVALGSVIFGAVTANLAGSICGFVMGFLASAPLLVGVYIGSKMSGLEPPRLANPVVCVAFVALLIPLENAAQRAAPEESVATTHVVEMTPDEAFARIQFYEDTSGIPPRLLRIALPRPIRTVGDGSRVGGRQRCIYDIGYLLKEITEVDPGVRYAFEVIKQVGVESHSVKLTSGSFDFARVDSERTRIVLTTKYFPKLSARLAWRPFERAVIEALHNHVVRSMTTNR